MRHRSPQNSRRSVWLAVPALAGLLGCTAQSSESADARIALQQQGISASESAASIDPILDLGLFIKLRQHGFTGRIQERVAEGLGRPIDAKVASLGRDLFFDSLLGLNDDNSC